MSDFFEKNVKLSRTSKGCDRKGGWKSGGGAPPQGGARGLGVAEGGGAGKRRNGHRDALRKKRGGHSAPRHGDRLFKGGRR